VVRVFAGQRADAGGFEPTEPCGSLAFKVQRGCPPERFRAGQASVAVHARPGRHARVVVTVDVTGRCVRNSHDRRGERASRRVGGLVPEAGQGPAPGLLRLRRRCVGLPAPWRPALPCCSFRVIPERRPGPGQRPGRRRHLPSTAVIEFSFAACPSSTSRSRPARRGSLRPGSAAGCGRVRAVRAGLKTYRKSSPEAGDSVCDSGQCSTGGEGTMPWRGEPRRSADCHCTQQAP